MQTLLKRKTKEWFSRYAPAEMAGIVGTLVCGIVTQNLFNNAIWTALAATWGENLGYYTWIIYKEFESHVANTKKANLSLFFRVIKDVVFEFGPGELLDSSIIRPFAMYRCPVLTQNISTGLILGKIAADIIFYSLTISAFELRKRYLKS